MDTEERNRIMKAFYDPELNPVACLAKCLAGLAIVGLVGLMGIKFNESGKEKVADRAHVKTVQLQAEEAPRHEAAIHQEIQQARIGAKDVLVREHSKDAIYRAVHR